MSRSPLMYSCSAFATYTVIISSSARGYMPTERMNRCDGRQTWHAQPGGGGLEAPCGQPGRRFGKIRYFVEYGAPGRN